MKDFKETREVKFIDENTLQFFRTQLKDQSYVSKIYGFRNLYAYSNAIMKEEHFILLKLQHTCKIKRSIIERIV